MAGLDSNAVKLILAGVLVFVVLKVLGGKDGYTPFDYTDTATYGQFKPSAGTASGPAGSAAGASSAGAGAASTPPGVTVATAWPTVTVSPSATSTAVTVPASFSVYRTSMVTLSVSIWASTSSSRTTSPAGKGAAGWAVLEGGAERSVPSAGARRARRRGQATTATSTTLRPPLATLDHCTPSPGFFSTVATAPSVIESPIDGTTTVTSDARGADDAMPRTGLGGGMAGWKA